MRNESHKNSSVVVRKARERDVRCLLRLKDALQAEEGGALEVADRHSSSLARRMFGPRRDFEALVAEQAGLIVGMLIFSLKPYTGWPEPAIYVQDLFVADAYRRLGIGRQLLGALATRALELNAVHIELAVRSDNPARQFYERTGLVGVEEAVTYVASQRTMTLLALQARGV